MSNVRLKSIGDYKLGRILGRGNFAVVRLAKHRIARAVVAVKFVDRNAISAEDLTKFEREIAILKAIAHPHIIKLYQVIRTEQYLYMVTEYASGGEIYELLIKKEHLNEADARRYFKQLTSAVNYCHSHEIVHRDLKAENILIDSDDNIKVIDFGFSNVQQDNTLMKTFCGSPPYVAPELLMVKRYDGKKADVWSLGVILYILMTGKFPFPSDNLNKLKQVLFAGELDIPYRISVDCSNLIRKMLTIDPLKRFTIMEVAEHRWLCGKQRIAVTSTAASLSTPLLNPAAVVFIQQRMKWSEEHITNEVARKNFEGPVYALHELLRAKLPELTLADEDGLQLRRGSRGSIVSGKVFCDVENTAQKISAHQLAALGLSAKYENSDHSDISGAEEACLSGLSSTSAAHSAILTNDLYSPAEKLFKGMVSPAVVFSMDCDGRSIRNFNQYPSFPKSYCTSSFHDDPNSVHPNTSMLDENLHGASGIHVNQSNYPVHNLFRASGSPSTSNVDEEGHRYLRQFGSTKRNTIHGTSTPGCSSSSLRASLAPYLIQSSKQRRSSWTTVEQKDYFERIHQQSGASSEPVVPLQRLIREFQKLRTGVQTASTNSSVSLNCSTTHSDSQSAGA